jgi:hypothetical protein
VHLERQVYSSDGRHADKISSSSLPNLEFHSQQEFDDLFNVGVAIMREANRTMFGLDAVNLTFNVIYRGNRKKGGSESEDEGSDDN